MGDKAVESTDKGNQEVYLKTKRATRGDIQKAVNDAVRGPAAHHKSVELGESAQLSNHSPARGGQPHTKHSTLQQEKQELVKAELKLKSDRQAQADKEKALKTKLDAAERDAVANAKIKAKENLHQIEAQRDRDIHQTTAIDLEIGHKTDKIKHVIGVMGHLQSELRTIIHDQQAAQPQSH